MKEYIEREAVIQLIKKDGHDGDYNLGATADNEWFCAEVKRIPAANVVEVRHGRWLSKEYYDGAGLDDMWIARLAKQSDYYAYCSICGKDAEYNAEGSLILSDYCPNCGAKMDGGADVAVD